ncbi:hypothetical protein GR223_01105 [Rhizobium leguminosarum]|uniref:hypothetical protein n=1 Tax=Rhizobium ruizarguesonis TaxID=2081791 RepID=UPI001030A256|nr:hypothetical protein [Rhizobium ruizarguesonis]NEJ84565.1 hypothetical protein [Rhizobium ruizarguesonis]TBC70758.1 hypothetical protein ELH28_30245 [Rhizobium ruizarguesonis]TBE38913.1 hypothetical protein ELH06_32030 [Rhizobium ruizarguesonis]
MKNNRVAKLIAWLMQSGIEGMPEADLLSGFCTRCAASRVPVERASAVIEALHPMYERRAFRWDANNALERMSEFGMGTGGSLAMNWERTAFFYLRTTGDIEVRRRFSRGDAADFYLLDSMKADGFTDFVALAHRFGGNGTIGEIDCFFSQFATRAPGGFSEADLNALKALVPCLALATKCVAMSGVARTIAKVYLGEDAAQHVLHGEMRRDRADRIAAALWFSDLANFTLISDLSDPDEIIPMINDYAEAVISIVAVCLSASPGQGKHPAFTRRTHPARGEPSAGTFHNSTVRRRDGDGLIRSTWTSVPVGKKLIAPMIS